MSEEGPSPDLPQVMVFTRAPDGGVQWVLVTEEVRATLDALSGSLDWGSGYLDIDTGNAVVYLMKLLNFEELPDVWWANPFKTRQHQTDTELPPPGRACGLCGHKFDDPVNPCGYAAVGDIVLCHAADHSCYVAWTVEGKRP